MLNRFRRPALARLLTLAVIAGPVLLLCPSAKAETSGTLTTRVTIPAAQVLTLNSAPVTVVPGTASQTVFPISILVEKKAGSACTLGTATRAYISWSAPVSPTSGFPGGSFPLSAGDGVAVTRASGGSVVLYQFGIGATYTADSDAAGLGLVLATDHDMASGCEDWVVAITYRVLPASIQ